MLANFKLAEFQLGHFETLASKSDILIFLATKKPLAETTEEPK